MKLPKLKELFNEKILTFILHTFFLSIDGNRSVFFVFCLFCLSMLHYNKWQQIQRESTHNVTSCQQNIPIEITALFTKFGWLFLAILIAFCISLAFYWTIWFAFIYFNFNNKNLMAYFEDTYIHSIRTAYTLMFKKQFIELIVIILQRLKRIRISTVSRNGAAIFAKESNWNW